MSVECTTQDFDSRATRIVVPAYLDLEVWVFSLTTNDVLLCPTGEASVKLTPKEQNKKRTSEEWAMLLISKGMIAPCCHILGDWLAFKQSGKVSQTIKVDCD